ncbi:RluA family pseudouridine synthase [Sphingobacterium hungaricum]|nr:RluA family pseudouridine synthase [Sphingobacterium hungaricum]
MDCVNLQTHRMHMPQVEQFFHLFRSDISQLPVPEKFTFPFYYEPSELAKCAALELQDYLNGQTDFAHNFGLDDKEDGLQIGKMFGVLVVKNSEGKLGYLAAVSGKLGGKNQHTFFVPPIFDMLTTNSFFLLEEDEINQLNRSIEHLEESEKLENAKESLEECKSIYVEKLASMRALHKKNKADRKYSREAQKTVLNESDYAEFIDDLIKQSYRDQHHYDVLKKESQEQTLLAEENLSKLVSEINGLKDFRKKKSSELQLRLFEQYQFLNAFGEKKDVLSIFKEKLAIQPPAGAGECAAPKLLQYAFTHQLQPIALAEFWWGKSPSLEVRKHKNYYPACRGKCEPILGHMLQGLKIDDNPMLQTVAIDVDLEIIYEDDDLLVINKPSELLSVPGIQVKDSVQTRILERFPDLHEPVIIHRLDMSTSGIMLLAKNKLAHQLIQDQFIQHTIEKRYTALLDGLIPEKSGLIDLPLRVDLDDRPRQVVCYTHGKSAQTKYKIVQIENNKTRIHFYPLTGRTHQLRVHSAHHLGLNTAIVGDDLYGNRADRLHLHAGFIRFSHPTTKQRLTFEIADPF